MKKILLIVCMFLSHFAHASDGLIIASGFGASDLSKVPLEQQARIMAKRAAQLDAQRNLAEQIKGLRLTGGTIMEDFEVTSDKVGTRVKTVLRGAFEVDSITTKDEQTILVEVKMALCIDRSHEKCQTLPTLEEAVAMQ